MVMVRVHGAYVNYQLPLLEMWTLADDGVTDYTGSGHPMFEFQALGRATALAEANIWWAAALAVITVSAQEPCNRARDGHNSGLMFGVLNRLDHSGDILPLSGLSKLHRCSTHVIWTMSTYLGCTGYG